MAKQPEYLKVRTEGMEKGKVISFNPTKGYGWILGKSGKQYFAHCSKIVVRLEPRLCVDEYVQFESKKTAPEYKSDAAINIQPLSEIEDFTPYQIVQNPFNPRFPINRPEKFAGRKENIKTGTTYLLNKQNIIISGFTAQQARWFNPSKKIRNGKRVCLYLLLLPGSEHLGAI